MKIIFYGFAAILLLLGQKAEAQFLTDMSNPQISITLSPQYPTPGETVTATLDDYALGFSGSSITWILDGEVLADYQNQRVINFVASEIGTTQTISSRIQAPNGQMLSATQVISPLYVDVIIEPQTYTPIFYQGRGLPSFGSTVFLTALVHNAAGTIDPGIYTYSWFLNDQALSGGPIRGGYKTKMVVPYGANSVITLGITDPDGTTIARRLIAIPSVALDVQFYEVSTLFGINEKAIGGALPLLGNSSTVRAVPYNLDRTAVNTGLFTEWSINGRRQTNTTGDPFEVTLLRQGSGSSRIEFKIRNLSALIQSDEKSFTVQY